MNDLHPGSLDTLESLTHVIDEHRNVGVDRRCGIGGHQTELMPSIVAKGDDPSVIHQNLKAQHAPMLFHSSGNICDRQVRDDSFNSHRPTLLHDGVGSLTCARPGRELVTARLAEVESATTGEIERWDGDDTMSSFDG